MTSSLGSTFATRYLRIVFLGHVLVVLGVLTVPAIATAQTEDGRAHLERAVTVLKAKAAGPGARVRVIAYLSEAAVSASRRRGAPERNVAGAYVRSALTTAPARIVSAQDQLLRRMTGLGAVSAKRIEGVPMVVLEVNSAQLEALVSSGEVSAIFEDKLSRPTLRNSGPLIGANVAHDLGARGAGTTIAILDTGVSAPHEFFSGRVLNGACFSSNSLLHGSDTVCDDHSESSTAYTAGNPCVMDGCDHGTHVAGIAAGRASANFAGNGIAPDAKILPIQVFSNVDGKPRSLTSDQIAGLAYVRKRAALDNIVAANLSLGSEEHTSSCNNGIGPMVELVDLLRDMGVATVIASGNDGFDDAVSEPACISAAVTVGASNGDSIASFSNHSSLVDLIAPGAGIWSSVDTAANSYDGKSGTSMATPHVTGAIAVIRSKVAMSVDQMVALLQSTGDPLTDARNTPERVRINIGKAIEQVAPYQPPTVEIDRRRLIRTSTGRCLDAHGATARQDGGRVQVWSCNGNPQQLWTAFANGTIRNEAGGLCLDVHGPDIANDGGRVQVWGCNNSAQQRWKINSSQKSIKVSSGLCLDAFAAEQFGDGGRVIVHGCHGKPNQRWTFVSPDVLAREANVRTGAGLCLDVHAPEVATNGGRVQVWACGNRAQQRWTYDSATRAIRLASGLCLDAHKPQITTNGGRVQVWPCNGQTQQLWTPLANGALRNGGGLCLDVHATTQSNNGGLVQLWACNGQQQQRFSSNAF